jgi:ABC-type nitrate/sulfonate/bicarbonate transport system substrate-binding protein
MNTTNTATLGRAPRSARRGRRIGVALAALVVTAASACGSGNAAVGEGETVLVSVSIAAPSAGPVYLANALGYFKDAGLNVQVKEIANASLQIATGQVKYGLVNTSTLMQSASKNIGLQAVCVTQVDPSYILAVSDVVWKKRGLTDSMTLKEKLAALKGEQITAVGGGTTNPGAKLLQALLEKNGLPADTIGVLSMTSSSAATASFKNGQVGVIFQPQPQPDQVLSLVHGKILYNTGNSPLFAEMDNVPWSTLATSAKFAQANPDMTAKMCTAIGKANDYLDKNPVQAAEQLKNSMPTDLAILKDSMPTYKWAPAGKMSEADFARGVEVLGSMGMFAKVSPEQVKAAYTTAHQK